MSFFGGDPSRAHFSVNVRFCAYRGEPNSEARERRRNERAAIKAAGFGEERYFQFRVKDEAGKAKAKAEAEAYADKVRAATGVAVEVLQGCFL